MIQIRMKDTSKFYFWQHGRMTPFYLFEILYAIITFACGYYTFAEGSNNRSAWNPARILGVIICAFWPVLVLVILAQRVTRAGKAA